MSPGATDKIRRPWAWFSSATPFVNMSTLLAEARSAGRVRAGVDAGEVLVLVCGLAHGVRSAGLAPGSASAQTLLHLVLDGLRGGGPEEAPRGSGARPAT